MPTQQLVYEGTDLQALIQRVVDEHGPARIRPPERRRKGGVLGFFAREVYVISVDAEATERAGRPHEQTGRGPAVPAAAVVGAGRHEGRREGATSPAVPGSLADLIDATEDDLHLASSGTAPGPRTGTPGPPDDAPVAADEDAGPGTRPGVTIARPRTVKPFSQVLSEVASSLGEEPGTYRVDPDRLRRITPLVPPRAAAAGGSARALAAMVDHPSGTGTSPVLDDGPAPSALPAAPSEPAVAPARAVVAPSILEPAVAPAAPAPSPAPAARPTPQPRPGLGSAMVDLLLTGGFPATLLPQDVAALSGLEEAFARLPEAPPLPAGAGGLVAVVGDAALVRPLARSVASQAGCPEDEVAVVAPNAWHATPAYRARTARQAASLAGGWRRDRTGVVAVCSPALGTDQRWTREALHAVRPSCVWAVTTATTKPQDVRRWVDAIGGADALAVTGVTATTTPAAILSVGLPVVRLDHQRATAQRWAAVMADLLAGS